jgi:hypothetical protein
MRGAGCFFEKCACTRLLLNFTKADVRKSSELGDTDLRLNRATVVYSGVCIGLVTRKGNL